MCNRMHPAGLAAALAIMVTLALAAPERLRAHDASPHQGHDTPQFSAGEPGNPKRAAKVIEITMNEADGKMGFKPDKIEVRRGEQVRFVLKNAGALDHEFMLATRAENAKHAELMQKYPDMEHDDPNGTRIKSNAKGEILWRFTKRGEFEFACLIPGHYEAGMLGKVIVK